MSHKLSCSTCSTCNAKHIRSCVLLQYIAPVAAVAVFSEASSLDAFRVELTNGTAYVNSTDGTLVEALGDQGERRVWWVGQLSVFGWEQAAGCLYKRAE